MKLPKDLISQTYTKPRLFLCQTDKTRICQLETIEMSGSFKFNAYSELTFTVGRTYINMNTGETHVNPFYDKIEALRLVYLEDFGYFEIQDPEIVSDGIKEVKNVTAYSLEYTLSQKYLEELKINTGETDSMEVVYAEANDVSVKPITLLNENPELSLLHLVLEKIPGWTIGDVDPSLQTMSRTFEISRASVYDFIIQDICDQFNCFAVFDTVDNKINLYAEALVTKHIADGKTTVFNVSSPYNEIGSVSIDSYKTTDYTYEVVENSIGIKNGRVIFNKTPAEGAKIEITDGSQTKWMTDVYVTFDNLAQEVNVSYSADDIKTVLTVKGADNLDIREVNTGLPYIVDISYYYNVDWMGQDLFDAYTTYLAKINGKQKEYSENSEEILKLQNDISFIENKTSLGYGIDSSVNSETVGTYYVVNGGSYPKYTYDEKSLPADYDANETYYKLNGANVTEDKVHTLYSAVRKYFVAVHGKVEPEIEDIATRDGTWEELLEEIEDQFAFVPTDFDEFKSALTPNASVSSVKNAFKKFLVIIFQEMGRTPLKDLFLKPYTEIEAIHIKSLFHQEDSDNYWFYYPVTLMIESLNYVISERDKEIDAINEELKIVQKKNAEIADQLSIYNNFDNKQIIRLSSFLREDEYTDDNFIETELDTIETIMKTKQELLECGRIELSKLCEPKLAFSMDMANIYAMPEFEPIIDQFKLGNLITVAIRSDYVKRARLLAVDINFDDFSDFSCEFGELTSLRTPSSIHADLLATALSAGKSVASNASYWNKGVDTATKTDLKIQQGLLSMTNGLYTSDQSLVIDNNGILLRKVNENGEFSPHQAWLRNNTIALSSDGFKNSRTGLGEFTIGDRTFYGILAEAVLSGYIEGSTIVGGTIDIGDGNFIVDQKGNVTIKSPNSIIGYVTSEELLDTEEVLSARISVNADSISSKVNSGDFGTLIEQNYDHVKIAWNNNSKYIAFEDGALNIYTSSSHSSDTLLMKQNYQGAWYYHDGYTVGKIGTNNWVNDTSYRGLVFDLENDANYMCWAHKEDASDTDYTVKLIYHTGTDTSKGAEGLHFKCNTYCSGFLYLNDHVKTVNYNTGAGGLKLINGSYNSTIGVFLDAERSDSGTVTRFACYPERFVFSGSAEKLVDCYNNIDLHYFDILNQSDVRLKTNIQTTQVDALSVINQIELKEFDWIEDGTHEDIGIIAQQLQDVAPDLVAEDTSTGKLSVKLNKFIPYLIKAIQELSGNGVAMYALDEEDISWVDPYDLDEKQEFVQMIASAGIVNTIDEKVDDKIVITC